MSISSEDPFIPRADELSDRPSTEDCIGLLMDQLTDSIHRLTHYQGNGINLLERYDYFVRHSSKGRSCTYSHKCRQLFISELGIVKEEVLKVIEMIREIPGEENFGR